MCVQEEIGCHDGGDEGALDCAMKGRMQLLLLGISSAWLAEAGNKRQILISKGKKGDLLVYWKDTKLSRPPDTLCLVPLPTHINTQSKAERIWEQYR